MSEQKSLTLDEARAEIEHCAKTWEEFGHSDQDRGLVIGLRDALEFLARVEQPSEEDMAVLWLMKRGKPMAYGVNSQCWISSGLRISPTDEARKLGWKP